LARSRFGVVILSPAFFAKEWPQRELAGLAAREVGSGTKVILPVWHDLDHSAIVDVAPMLADRLGVRTAEGLDHVAKQLHRALEAARDRAPDGGQQEAVLQAAPHAPERIPAGILQSLAQIERSKGDLLAADAHAWEAARTGSTLTAGGEQPPAWRIVDGPVEVEPTGDHVRFAFHLSEGAQTLPVFVEISGSANASDPETLPGPVRDAIRTNGRSAVEHRLVRVVPPTRLVVTTAGIRTIARQGAYWPGDLVAARETDGAWHLAEFLRTGDPDEATVVEDPRVIGGAYKRDVAWVRRLDDGRVVPYAYKDLRPEPPAGS
jgi:hypothetical protein